MNDVIRQLPDSVANQIAAGEVIQSPASVVKELAENAVDAGAHSIAIIVKDAGKTLIQVVDDGCGMSDTDARMAFEKHATSKIRLADDLFDLHTMGFRGEALASIAAVAQVELRTMLRGASVGTRIILNGSQVESQEPAACSEGSNMMVKNLFFNIPARRKFLKKDAVELAGILREFERLALVNPGLNFSFTSNDTPLHQLMKGSLKQRIVGLFGKSLDKQLIPVETETSLVKIEGFVCLPQFARRRNQLEYFFVNGRNMRHPYFHKAVVSCYEQLIPADQKPNYFLRFTVDPSTIDVNIHPTKNEIKFENEAAIWQILVAAVKEALGRFNAVPAIDFDTEDMPDILAFGPDTQARRPEIELDATYNPFAAPVSPPSPATSSLKNQSSGGGNIPSAISAALSGETISGTRTASGITAAAGDWDRLYSDFNSDIPAEVPANGISPSKISAETASGIVPEEDTVQACIFPESGGDGGTFASAITPASPQTADIPGIADVAAEDAERLGCIQLKNRYIAAPSSRGLMLIDQHRAHLRVLYERYIDLAALNAMNSQRVMFPEVLRLSPAGNAIMEMIEPQVAALGFDVSCLGDNAWSLNGAPAVLDGINPADTLLKIIEQATETGCRLGDDLRAEIALMMARSVAVRPGQPLTQAEMDHLMSDLFKLPSPTFTPDGHRIIAVIETPDIARLF